MKFTTKFVDNVKKPGRYFDDSRTGLSLLVKSASRKSWVQRLTIGGKRKDIGLGSARFVSLKEGARNGVRKSESRAVRCDA